MDKKDTLLYYCAPSFPIYSTWCVGVEDANESMVLKTLVFMLLITPTVILIYESEREPSSRNNSSHFTTFHSICFLADGDDEKMR